MASLPHSSTAKSPSPGAFARGDHLCVSRGYLWHHGLYVGAGEVIHVASADSGGKASASIRRANLAEFAQGDAVKRLDYGSRLTADESVERAEASLGRGGYHLTANNCEHFVTWCVTGRHSSAQVENVSSAATFVGATIIAPRAGVGLVGHVGETPAMSAPNLMSGLRTVGGGSAVTGIGVLSTAGALVGACSMCTAFRDHECLTADQRSARGAARVGGIVGGALGVSAVLCSTGALGVPGYSAAGLSSGLAAFGTPLGGGMSAGVALVVVAPALLAGLFAVLFCYLSRWLQSRQDFGLARSAA
jgi:Lecithin retinol acyltransferase